MYPLVGGIIHAGFRLTRVECVLAFELLVINRGYLGMRISPHYNKDINVSKNVIYLCYNWFETRTISSILSCVILGSAKKVKIKFLKHLFCSSQPGKI